MKILKEDASSNRKKKFIKLYNNQSLNNHLYINNVEQHHINGTHSDNPNDMSNHLYIYAPDREDARAIHNYIHALGIINNFKMPEGAELMVIDNGKVTNIPASISNLQYFGKKLTSDGETYKNIALDKDE